MFLYNISNNYICLWWDLCYFFDKIILIVSNMRGYFGKKFFIISFSVKIQVNHLLFLKSLWPFLNIYNDFKVYLLTFSHFLSILIVMLNIFLTNDSKSKDSIISEYGMFDQRNVKGNDWDGRILNLFISWGKTLSHIVRDKRVEI